MALPSPTRIGPASPFLLVTVLDNRMSVVAPLPNRVSRSARSRWTDSLLLKLVTQSGDIAHELGPFFCDPIRKEKRATREVFAMQLLIIRHGIAEDKADFAKTGKSDDLRPLTAEGRAAMAQVAKGLRESVPEISELATSPLVRARETAEIVARAYAMQIGATTEVLVPDARVEQFVEWIADRAKRDIVAIVGHEPHLSGLATWLMCGAKESHIELKKGGACLLSFRGTPRAASGTLEWSMYPRQLRALGEGFGRKG